MASITFHLVALSSASNEESFLAALRNSTQSERPLYVGRCRHWIHAPHVSASSFIGEGNVMQSWDYLIINKTAELGGSGIFDDAKGAFERTWSITGTVDDAYLALGVEAQRTRSAASIPTLPEGWSADNRSALDAAVPPPDLEASLALSTYPLGSRTEGNKNSVALKDLVRTFGSENAGPVNMFNLLAYLPDQRPRYLQYIAAFTASVGSKYGGEPMLFGTEVSDWSSKLEDTRTDPDAVWSDFALIYYPSLWHFGCMLDDEAYMDVDRRYKQGVLRDNPIMLCTEVDLE